MFTFEKDGRAVTAMIMDEPVNGVLGVVQCSIQGCEAYVHVSSDPRWSSPGEQVESFALEHDCDPSRFPVEGDDGDEGADEDEEDRSAANDNEESLSQSRSRDPARIQRVLDALSAYWEARPELRLCQIIGNLANDTAPLPSSESALHLDPAEPEVSGRVYNIEDDKVIAYLESKLVSVP